MGVSYTAYAVIGFKVDHSLLFKPGFRKAFKHDYPYDANKLYCPKTGKKLYEAEDEPIEGFDPENDKFGEYDVITAGMNDYNTYFIGFIVENEYDEVDGVMPLPNNENIQKLQDDMTKAFPNKKLTFGLYAVLYCG